MAEGAVTISVHHVSHEQWNIVYETPEPTHALHFLRQGTSFRQERCRAISDEVVVGVDSRTQEERITSENEDQQVTKFEISCDTKDVEVDKDYRPSYLFSDGGVLFYTGQFDVTGYSSPTEFVLFPKDNEKVQIPGRGALTRATYTVDDEETYVYFGNVQPELLGSVPVYFDPALPGWLRGQLEIQIPQILSFYTQRLGPLSEPPTIYVNFVHGNPGELSSKGGQVGKALQMEFDGNDWDAESRKGSLQAIKLLAHELSHFWGTDHIDYEPLADWISEGSAEFLSWLVLRDVGYCSQEEYDRKLNEAYQQCYQDRIAASTDRAFSSPYACGGTVLSATEMAMQGRGEDIFDFLSELYRRARTTGGIYTQQMFTELLAEKSGSHEIGEAVWQLMSNRSVRLENVFENLFPGHEEIIRGTVEKAANRELGIKAFKEFMSMDCHGQISFYGEDDYIRVAGASCEQLQAGYRVQQMGGHHIYHDGMAAYDYLYQQCATGGAVALTMVGEEDPLVLKCPRPIPSR